MDSFDESPAATMLELAMCQWLCKEVGWPESSGAVFTSGGSQSNFMGLLLGRDTCIASRWNWPVAEKGLHPESNRLRFLCSEVAHFTVEKAASHLGLGSQAVASLGKGPDLLAVTLRANLICCCRRIIGWRLMV